MQARVMNGKRGSDMTDEKLIETLGDEWRTWNE